MSLSLREWKVEHGRQEAEKKQVVLERAEVERVRRKFVHPLVKAGYDRNVREAYFGGLVHAGLCDDRRIDENEGRILWTIGTLLGISEVSIVDIIDSAEKADYARKMQMFVESLNELRNSVGVNIRQLFAMEYARIRLSSSCMCREDELNADFEDIGQELEVPLDGILVKVVSISGLGTKSEIASIDGLACLIGDDATEYFAWIDVGDVGEKLKRYRAQEAVNLDDALEDRGDDLNSTDDDACGAFVFYTIDGQKCQCVGCDQCASVCPASAIIGRGPRPFINRYACIRCGKCSEVCTFHAIQKHAAKDAAAYPFGMMIDRFEERRKRVPPFSLANLPAYYIDPNKCKGCTLCARACPESAIVGKVKYSHEINQELCRRCGLCAQRCLFGAINNGTPNVTGGDGISVKVPPKHSAETNQNRSATKARSSDLATLKERAHQNIHPNGNQHRPVPKEKPSNYDAVKKTDWSKVWGVSKGAFQYVAFEESTEALG